MPFPPNPQTFSSGSPANISANVGQVGGTPLTPSDVNNYLTQLGGALNGFAGTLANTLNYLLVQGIFISKTVRVGILGQNLTPVYNQSAGGSWAGMAQAGQGSVFTPSSTGRIIVAGFMTGTLNFPQAASVQSNINFHLFMGQGTAGPNYGDIESVNVPPQLTALGPGFSTNWAQGTHGGYGLQQSGLNVATVSGLNKQRSYWIDMVISSNGNAASGGTAVMPTYVLVVEW